jgi:hypothetical protein
VECPNVFDIHVKCPNVFDIHVECPNVFAIFGANFDPLVIFS